MGIVVKQSVRNTVVTYIGFAVGAVNALYLYPVFLGDTHYGLTAFILSTANIAMPFMAMGLHNTLVKYYALQKSEHERMRLLNFSLWLPLLVLLPVFGLLGVFYDSVAGYVSQRNPILFDYLWQVPLIGLCMGYFEIFYAWVKVRLRSVYGSFIREVLLRLLISAGLSAVYFRLLSPEAFVWVLLLIYALTTAIMAFSAFRLHAFKFGFELPASARAVLVYSGFIVLAGSVANLLLEIDKSMLGYYLPIEHIAYYSVAIFMATVIAVPSRAMHQIAYPITAQLMAREAWGELNAFYKKTSITLQFAGGLVFGGILVNLNQIYALLPPAYVSGATVVMVIGLSKYFDLILGNNNAIIFNSRYYRTVLGLGLMLALLTIGLNIWLIPKYQIDGAAWATLISITLYSLAKLSFVVRQMKLFPFSWATVYSLGVLGASVGLFYFWEFDWHPLLNIGLKSALLTAVYVGLHYFLKLSPDVNAFIGQAVRRVFKKIPLFRAG